eukprot:TRINITY_DN69560_c0_g1_i1.p1 TRINITY_DN69560_c0_g1~~TRINITY_DN69560_c0_g1_i1.p1  ORF type:complete len:419 (-),score=75.56 TRINITY_DN69560_c0_g1_i1:142-1398(-)
MCRLGLIVSLSFAALSLVNCLGPVVTNISIPQVAFAVQPPGRNVLYCTSFGPLKSGKLLAVDDPFGAPSVKVLHAGFKWPNTISVLDSDTLGVADGFLLPTSNPGAFYTYSVSTGALRQLSASHGEFFGPFYTLSMRDPSNPAVILASRAYDTLITKESKLVGFFPGSAAADGAAVTERVIADGIDFAFDAYADADNTTVVVGGSFLHQTLTVLRLRESRVVASATVDPSAGPVFSVQFADVNGDGRRDILMTTSSGGAGGGVYAYEMPHTDPVVGTGYVKRTIATGFPSPSGEGKAAPGGALVVPRAPGLRPPVAWGVHAAGGGYDRRTAVLAVAAAGRAGAVTPNDIVLGGDDNGHVYRLSPATAGPTWTFRTSLVASFGGTIGSPSAAAGGRVLLPNYVGSRLLAFEGASSEAVS